MRINISTVVVRRIFWGINKVFTEYCDGLEEDIEQNKE
jgi:hypothetical protein